MLRSQELPSGELLRFVGRILRLLSTPFQRDAVSPLELSGSYLLW